MLEPSWAGECRRSIVRARAGCWNTKAGPWRQHARTSCGTAYHGYSVNARRAGLGTPSRYSKASSMQITVTCLAGSLLLLCGGVWDFAGSSTNVAQAIALFGVPWLVNSALFAVQGALMYLEQINPAVADPSRRSTMSRHSQEVNGQ